MPWNGFETRQPVGPGSRGGHWHEPEYRHEYMRRWRAAHPAYRERERLRNARRRAELRGDDPAMVTVPSSKTSQRLPPLPGGCSCACGCDEDVQVCGFCARGLHR